MLLRVYHDSMFNLLEKYSKNVIRKNFLDCYFIFRFGSSAAELFPYEELQRQLKQFGRFGLIMASMVLPLFTSAQDELPNLDEMCEEIERNQMLGENIFKFEKTQTLYATKMREIIIDMDRLGYI